MYDSSINYIFRTINFIFKKGNIFQGFLLLAVTTAVFYGAYKLYLIYRGKNKGRDKKNIKSTPNSVELATKGGKIIMNNPFRGLFVSISFFANNKYCFAIIVRFKR